MNPVTAGLRANVHHRIPRSLGKTGKDFLLTKDPKIKCVDQNVGVVAFVEITFTAYGGYADAVTVAANAGDHASQQITRARMIDIAEAERVERCDRPRAHGENVAQNAADAGRGPLERLNEGRMIMAFHLKSHGESIANVDNTGVLARPLEHVGAFRRQIS